jgi:hypothetical protein
MRCRTLGRAAVASWPTGASLRCWRRTATGSLASPRTSLICVRRSATMAASSERLTTAATTVQKASSPPHTSKYGFKLNAASDAYNVNEAETEVVRRIFRMVGAEGRVPSSLARVLERQGVPSCKGTKRWDRSSGPASSMMSRSPLLRGR